MKLNAKELRNIDNEVAQTSIINRQTHPIYLILENVYDTYNIGGLFRLADAIGVEKMYLCGQMEIPPNPKIKKASIGTYKIVPWEYKKTVKEAIEGIKLKVKSEKLKVQAKSQKLSNNLTIQPFNNDLKVVAVEQSSKSVPYIQADYSTPIALIVGNETFGVLPETLKLADQIVEIPMFGINKSLNVIVSAAIVSYWVLNNLKLEPEVGIGPTV